MIAGLLRDEATREVNDVTPHHGRDERSRMESLRKNGQTAERMVDTREIFFEMAADLARRFQARQNVDKAKQRNPERFVF